MTAVWLQTHRKGLGPADETRTIGKCQAYTRKVKPKVFCGGGIWKDIFGTDKSPKQNTWRKYTHLTRGKHRSFVLFKLTEAGQGLHEESLWEPNDILISQEVKE